MTSRHLSWLEADLATQLVRRTTRRLTLTNAGQEFLVRARAVLVNVEEAREAVRPGLGVFGRIAVSAPGSFGLLRVAARFVAPDNHPRLHVDLRLEDRTVDLLAKGVDIAIRAGALPPSSRSITFAHDANMACIFKAFSPVHERTMLNSEATIGVAESKEIPMSYITAIDPSTAPPTVRPLLDGVQKGMGATPNMFRVAAQSPVALESLVAQFGAMDKGSFNARTREALALVVSESNACDYCISAHTMLGRRAGLNDEALEQVRFGKSDDAHLDALLKLARTVVNRRGHIGDALDEARRSGITDAEIVELLASVALTTFTNYLNVVAGTEIDFPVVRHREH
jgi:uncharacterized peroxidase-related enzyme